MMNDETLHRSLHDSRGTTRRLLHDSLAWSLYWSLDDSLDWSLGRSLYRSLEWSLRRGGWDRE